MENEIWKKIEEYNGVYLISNFGNIISNKFNKRIRLKPGINSNGYYIVSLSKNKIRKTLLVHRLVTNAFIQNPENKPEVNHRDGNKLNNNLYNLEWVTPKQNIQHGWKTGLMENTRKAVKYAWDNGLMENSKKNIIIAQESRKIQIFSKKLNMQFESYVEAATYLKTYYFENTTLICLRTTIGRLLNNKIKKSKYDFSWEYVNNKPMKTHIKSKCKY